MDILDIMRGKFNSNKAINTNENISWFVDNVKTYLEDLSNENKISNYVERARTGFSFDGMIHLLDVMNKHEDKRYIKYIYDAFMERYRNVGKSNFKNSVFIDRGYYSFFINLCIICNAYQKYGYGYNGNQNINESSFENFCCLVDDVINYDIMCDSGAELKIIGEKDRSLCFGLFGYIDYYLFDYLDSDLNYSNIPNLRKAFKKGMEGIVDLLKRETTRNNVSMFSKFMEDYREVKDETDFFKLDDFNRIVGVMVSDEKDSFFYNKILLYGNRFFYLNNKLKEIEDNDEIRKELFQYIPDRDKMFMMLNFGRKDDSFIEIMDIVFDSDSYQELLNKLKVIKNASDCVLCWKYSAAQELLKSLVNGQSKALYCNKIIEYPQNTMNRVAKHKRIVDRMKYIYSKIDSSISYDFMDLVHEKSNNISEFTQGVVDGILAEKRKLYLSEAKNKIKKIGESFFPKREKKG